MNRVTSQGTEAGAALVVRRPAAGWLQRGIVALAFVAILPLGFAQTILLEDNFESGGLDWDLTGLWHVVSESNCAPTPPAYVSATRALVFNDESTCTYDTGEVESGYATYLQPVSIPSDADAVVLRFQSAKETEGSSYYDAGTVEVSNDDGATWTQRFLLGSAPSWQAYEVNLSAYAGQTIRFRFRFDTIDEVLNGYRGWFIDDVQIQYSVLPPGVSRVSVGDVTVDEGDNSLTTLSFPLAITPPNPNAITLQVRTIDGTALASQDYVGINPATTVTIPPQTGASQVDVTVLGDFTQESTEYLLLEISQPSSNALLGRSTAFGYINDDDVPTTAFEDDFESGASNWTATGLWHVQDSSGCLFFDVGYISPIQAMVFNDESTCAYLPSDSGTLELSDDILIPETVALPNLTWYENVAGVSQDDFYHVDISEDGGQNWVELLGRNGTAPGWRQQTIDLLPYAGKSIRIRFRFEAGASGGGIGWYIDDVSVTYVELPQGVSGVNVQPVQVAEGDAGQTLMAFPVTINPPSATPITLQYKTRAILGYFFGAQATPGTDYVVTDSSITIPAQATQATITVPIVGDTTPEPAETLEVGLSITSGANAALIAPSVQGQILDDDTPSTLTITPSSVSEAAGLATFTVTASPVRTTPITFTYKTYEGSAWDNIDFVPATGNATIPANQASTTFQVQIRNDEIFEPSKYFYIALSNVSSNAYTPNNHYVIINDDDGPQLLFSDNFENGLDNWTTTGLWHIENDSTCISPGYSSAYQAAAYNAAGCVYEDNSTGELTLNTDIAIPADAAAPVLKFYDYAGVEDCCDFYRVQFSTDSGSTWPLEVGYSGDKLTWGERAVSLVGFKGQSIRIRFQFASDISITDVGWFVDDVRIYATDQTKQPLTTISVSSAPSITEGSPREYSDTTLFTNGSSTTFTLTFSPAPTQPVTLNYETRASSTASNKATPGEDFVLTSGELLIPANTTTYQIPITVNKDRKPESDEYFELRLSNPQSNVSLSNFGASAVILDDDYPAGTAFLHSSSYLYRRNVLNYVYTSTYSPLPGGSFVAAEFLGSQFDRLLGYSETSERVYSFVSVDTRTGGTSTLGSNISMGDRYIQDMAYDHTTGDLFVATSTLWYNTPSNSWNHDEYGLHRVNPANGGSSTTVVSSSSPARFIQGIAIHPVTGVLYVLAGNNDIRQNYTLYLYQMDKSNGSWLDSGKSTGLTMSGYYDNSLDCDFDTSTGELYASAYTNSGSVTVKINLDTGESTPANGYVSQGYGLAVASPPPTKAVQWAGDARAVQRGKVITSSNAGSYTQSGRDITGVGDVNGDGNDDFILASPRSDAPSKTAAGKAYLIFGPLPTNLSTIILNNPDLPAGVVGAVFSGAAANESLGVCAGPAGDVNNDGYTDFLVGYNDNTTGQAGAYLVYGNNSFPSSTDMSNLSGYPTNRRPVKLFGLTLGSATWGETGVTSAAVGDFNRDAFSDFVVANTASSSSAAITTYLVFGGPSVGVSGQLNLESLNGTNGIKITGATNNTWMAPRVSSAGDFNGDGLDDIVIGSPNANTAYVLFGNKDYGKSTFSAPSFNSIVLSGTGANLKGTITQPQYNTQTSTMQVPGIVFTRSSDNNRFGMAPSGVGDTNGDGFDDLLIGFQGSDGNGRAVLIYGTDSLVDTISADSSSLSTLGRGAQFSLPLSTADAFGYSVSGAGDLNRDGLMDFLIGAPNSDPEFWSDNGRARVLYGSRTSSWSWTDPLTSYQIINTLGDTMSYLGRGVAIAGDLNNDGNPDIGLRASGLFGTIHYATGASPSLTTYKNRMRAGEQILLPTPGDESVKVRPVGMAPGSYYRVPQSRVAIGFKGGGSGNGDAQSGQTVTIYRSSVPDRGQEELRSNLYWQILTDRVQFSESTIVFHYRPEDLDGPDGTIPVGSIGMWYTPTEPSSTSGWAPLPTLVDPIRRTITVRRLHDKEQAQNDFNGFYTILQATQKYELGKEIPPVGVTSSTMHDDGPIVTPSDAAFWHRKTKKLYAAKRGPIRIQWRTTGGQIISDINATNEWPSDEGPAGVYQSHVANTPPVDVSKATLYPTSGPAQTITFSTAMILDSDGSTNAAVDSVQGSTSRPFTATGPGRTLLLLSRSTDPGQSLDSDADIYFFFVRTREWTDANILLDSQPSVVGTEIVPLTEYHNVTSGPYVFNELSRYCARPGYYDRVARTGPVIPVNTDIANTINDDMVVVYYFKTKRLINPLAADPTNSDPDKRFGFVGTQQQSAWPHKPIRYNVQWPSVSAGDTLVIARQDGLIPDPVQYNNWSLYYENDATKPGFNPNDEHAIVRTVSNESNTVTTIFALRDDLATPTTSESYALIAYADPDNPVSANRPQIKVFDVVATSGIHAFSEWPSVSNDPYERFEAADIIIPPTPLYLMSPDFCSETAGVDGPWYKDKNGQFWVRAAGDDGGPDTITLRYYYPVEPGFYFPDDFYPGNTKPAEGAHIPWLDRRAGTPGTPINVTYTVNWPVDVPELKVGQTLIQAFNGLPDVDSQCSVDIVYQQSVANSGPNKPSVHLIDPVQPREINLTSMPPINRSSLSGGVNDRLKYDDTARRLRWIGIIKDATTGYVLLNVMTERERDELLEDSVVQGLSPQQLATWNAAVANLYNAAKDPVFIEDTATDPYQKLALTAGFAKGIGYVTLAMQDNPGQTCLGLPVTLYVIRVVNEIDPGAITAIYPDCPFNEKLIMRHKGNFAGRTGEYEFQWKFLEDVDGAPPAIDDRTSASPIDNGGAQPRPWISINLTSGNGANEVIIKGATVRTITDNWYICRFRYVGAETDVPWYNAWSRWTEPELGEGWIKRVVGEFDPFDQRPTGGTIDPAEDKFEAYSKDVDTIVSMLSQAGARYTGDVALNCDAVQDRGLIEIYETVLKRGSELSIKNLTPNQIPDNAYKALLFAAGRTADLYMLLGNEAFADAADPTIGFGTDDGQYGAEATSIHAFMNQTSSLLEEELALLRGRDDSVAPGVTKYPYYNRLIWNFTKGLDGGEVAYALNYNILGNPSGSTPDREIGEDDAKLLYPQGHGDAWGHYLTSISNYYGLLRHQNYIWKPRAEALTVAGTAVTVDYFDERKFASVAAAKARTGAEIVNLTYRSAFVDNPEGQWQGYKDTDSERAWGASEWAQRAGVGSYVDWVVGNAILPAHDTANTGIQKIDRTTVRELREVASKGSEIQQQLDNIDRGLNPLGLATNVIPFDINPGDITAGKTHFEQIYDRAVQTTNNAITVFNHAYNSTQLLRRQADSLADFQRTVENAEADFTNRLIEIFGTPYTDDIGVGRTYPVGYAGPDLKHYMYFDFPELEGWEEDPDKDVSYTVEVHDVNPSTGQSTSETVAFNLSTARGKFSIDKPATWTGERKSPGEIQMAMSDLVQARIRFERAIGEYENLLDQIEDQRDQIRLQTNFNTDQINILNQSLNEQQRLNDMIKGSRQRVLNYQRGALAASRLQTALSESAPKVTGVIAGLAGGVIADFTSGIRSALQVAGAITSSVLTDLANNEGLKELGYQQSKENASALTNIRLTALSGDLTVQNMLIQLEQLVRGEAGARLELYSQFEALQQTAGRYMAALARGERLLDEQYRFRAQTATQIQERRYKDMAFRIFRNDALQKYRAQFDLAARYVFLAAKAYDYETCLLNVDSGAGSQFLTDIVRERMIGNIGSGGLPLTGVGLADPLARMSQNFQVLKGQLGFNNPQTETNRFSLRSELYRIPAGTQGNTAWKELLRQSIVPNVLDLPEFRRYARVFTPTLAMEPAIVLDFGTHVNFGMNFFVRHLPNGEIATVPLGGGDSAYDSTNFATKIRTVGVWFSNYNTLAGSGLSNTPRVYLIPLGADILRSPSSNTGETREFRVFDQRLPVPFPLGSGGLSSDPGWIPIYDTLGGQFGEIRRYSSFRAYHDSGSFDQSQVTSDSRLIGRSVWNTRWLLIIPAGTLQAGTTDPVTGTVDRMEGLRTFIDGPLLANGQRSGQGVSDIKLFFQTYAYSGAKGAKTASGAP